MPPVNTPEVVGAVVEEVHPARNVSPTIKLAARIGHTLSWSHVSPPGDGRQVMLDGHCSSSVANFFWAASNRS